MAGGCGEGRGCSQCCCVCWVFLRQLSASIVPKCYCASGFGNVRRPPLPSVYFCNTLSRYEPIFEELDVHTVQDLQKLDIAFVKKVFPEFGLDFDACNRLQKLKDIDSDFIFNSFASVDFDVAKNILEMHCYHSREGSKSATKISSFYGSCNASTVFALFLSRGNYSHFQLSSFLSLHPRREAWVVHAEGKSEATFLFAAEHERFFSPAPVWSVPFFSCVISTFCMCA